MITKCILGVAHSYDGLVCSFETSKRESSTCHKNFFCGDFLCESERGYPFLTKLLRLAKQDFDYDNIGIGKSRQNIIKPMNLVASSKLN